MNRYNLKAACDCFGEIVKRVYNIIQEPCIPTTRGEKNESAHRSKTIVISDFQRNASSQQVDSNYDECEQVLYVKHEN